MADDCNGGDGNDDSGGEGNDAAPATYGNNVDDYDGGDSRTAIGRWQFDDNDGTTRMYIDVDGKEGNGKDGDGDSNGDGNGNGDGNDAAAAANGNDVDEDDSGNSRTTIG